MDKFSKMLRSQAFENELNSNWSISAQMINKLFCKINGDEIMGSLSAKLGLQEQ